MKSQRTQFIFLLSSFVLLLSTVRPVFSSPSTTPIPIPYNKYNLPYYTYYPIGNRANWTAIIDYTKLVWNTSAIGQRAVANFRSSTPSHQPSIAIMCWYNGGLDINYNNGKSELNLAPNNKTDTKYNKLTVTMSGSRLTVNNGTCDVVKDFATTIPIDEVGVKGNYNYFIGGNATITVIGEISTVPIPAMNTQQLVSLSEKALQHFVNNQALDGSFPEFPNATLDGYPARLWKWTYGDDLTLSDCINSNPNNYAEKFMNWLIVQSNIIDLGIPKAKTDTPNLLSTDEKKVFNFWESYIYVRPTNVELGIFAYLNKNLTSYTLNTTGLFFEDSYIKLVGFGKYVIHNCSGLSLTVLEDSPVSKFKSYTVNGKAWTLIYNGLDEIALINKTVTNKVISLDGPDYLLDMDFGLYYHTDTSVTEEIIRLNNKQLMNYSALVNLMFSHGFSSLPVMYDRIKNESYKKVFYKMANVLYRRYTDTDYVKEAYDCAYAVLGLYRGSISFGNSTLLDMAKTIVQNILDLQTASGQVNWQGLVEWSRDDWVSVCVEPLIVTGHEDKAKLLTTYLHTLSIGETYDYARGNLVYGLSFYNKYEAKFQCQTLINHIDNSTGLTSIANGETLACVWRGIVHCNTDFTKPVDNSSFSYVDAIKPLIIPTIAIIIILTLIKKAILRSTHTFNIMIWVWD